MLASVFLCVIGVLVVLCVEHASILFYNVYPCQHVHASYCRKRCFLNEYYCSTLCRVWLLRVLAVVLFACLFVLVVNVCLSVLVVCEDRFVYLR